MIPRIQTGSSFKGVGLYYLHDKKRDGEAERLTTHRVAWTHAVNTLEEEPEAVLSEMRQTVRDQQLLKQLSGNRLDGRPTERTVMTIALSWSPEQKVSRDEMIQTGQSFLKHMKLDEHQVLFVAHNDTRHPHVHLIVNRVHPETGMTHDSNWYKTRSQKWALAYEREQGRIYCEAREARYGRDEEREAANMTYREWTTLKENQRQERTAYWNETGDMRKALRLAVREEVRAEFSKQWQAYAQQKEKGRNAMHLYDQEARRAMRHYRSHGPLHGVEAVHQIKERQKAYHARIRKELADRRAEINAQQHDRYEELAKPALEALSNDRSANYKDVLARHRDERSSLQNDQNAGDRRHHNPSRLTQEKKEKQQDTVDRLLEQRKRDREDGGRER